MKIKRTALIGFGALCLWLFFWPSEKDRLNVQMAELCKIDGGVKIYEKVRLPGEMFDESGGLKNRKFIHKDGKELMLIGNDYILIEESTPIKNGDPQKNEGRLSRTHSEIRHIADDISLAEAVEYRRTGGDRWFAGMPSSESCPENPIDLFNKVFSK